MRADSSNGTLAKLNPLLLGFISGLHAGVSLCGCTGNKVIFALSAVWFAALAIWLRFGINQGGAK